uniref:SAP domain-containing ribonucleoprotein n=2 Tax=Rhinopithecus TaxID=542827 RepID=A0A2K6LLL7_RHIBE
MATQMVELHKLKLAGLKQECLARGLETKGIKQDFINRLQAYLEANEKEGLGDETEEEETKSIELSVKEEEPLEKTVDVAAEKKVVKIISEIPQTEKMQKRSKKAAGTGLVWDFLINLGKLKERAQRFGLNVSSISRKSENDEKLKKRKESSAGTGTTEDIEAKQRKGAERFGIA